MFVELVVILLTSYRNICNMDDAAAAQVAYVFAILREHEIELKRSNSPECLYQN